MKSIDQINQALCTGLNNAKIYGEGRAVEKKEGLAYVTKDMKPCSVDAGFETVLFWTKESANPVGSGFGRQKVSRTENRYALAVNSKTMNHDKILSLISGFCNYQGSSFASIQIADQYFGLSNGNRETHFFTIEFTILENIEPDICPDC